MNLRTLALFEWHLLVLFCVVLSGCSTFSPNPSVPSHSQQQNDLDISDYEVEFNLMATQGQTKEQIEATERSLIPTIESECTNPAYKNLGAATDGASVLIEGNMILNAVDQYFTDSEVIDRAARDCMVKLGVTGAPFIITKGRGRMSVPAYAAAVREYAHQVLANKIQPTQLLVYLRSGGCGSRGGPGYRLANGKCASWNQ